MKNRQRDITVVSLLATLIALVFMWEFFFQTKSSLIDPKLSTKQYAVIDNIKQGKVKPRGSYTYHAFGGNITAGKYALNEKNTYTSVFERYLGEGYGGHPSKRVTILPKLSDRTSSNINNSIRQSDKIISVELEDTAISQGVSAKKAAKYITTTIEKVHKKNDKTKIIVLSAWGSGKKAKNYNKIIKAKVDKYENIAVFVDISKISKQADTSGPANLYTHYGISNKTYPNNFGMRLIAYEMFQRFYKIAEN